MQKAAERGGYGGERYEQLEFQRRVAQSYKMLSDPTWKVVSLVSFDFLFFLYFFILSFLFHFEVKMLKCAFCVQHANYPNVIDLTSIFSCQSKSASFLERKTLNHVSEVELGHMDDFSMVIIIH